MAFTDQLSAVDPELSPNIQAGHKTLMARCALALNDRQGQAWKLPQVYVARGQPSRSTDRVVLGGLDVR